MIHRRGPWRSFEAVEFATLEWVDWFNNRRLLEPIGNIPPAEAEQRYYGAGTFGTWGAHQKPYLQDQSIDLNQERLYWPVATLQLGMRQVLLVIYGILCRQRIGV